MTDYTELKRLAEAAKDDPDSPYIPCQVAFNDAANPAAVLALIAENERLEAEAETERMRLAACGMAALGHHKDGDPIHESYHSASLADVLGLRAEVDVLRKDAARLDRLDMECEAYGTDIHEGNRWVLDGPFATVRDAIDAALTNS